MTLLPIPEVFAVTVDHCNTDLECAVVWRRELLDDVPHEDEPLVLLRLGGLDEALVQVVRAHRVGQLAEVHLQQGGHAVDALDDN